jgi:hypothetical protein
MEIYENAIEVVVIWVVVKGIYEEGIWVVGKGIFEEGIEVEEKEEVGSGCHCDLLLPLLLLHLHFQYVWEKKEEKDFSLFSSHVLSSSLLPSSEVEVALGPPLDHLEWAYHPNQVPFGIPGLSCC